MRAEIELEEKKSQARGNQGLGGKTNNQESLYRHNFPLAEEGSRSISPKKALKEEDFPQSSDKVL